jgi:ribosomal-protein-alanine N-acetyltransferase
VLGVGQLNIMINRVFIREHISSDADAYIEWQTDTGIARYLSWLPRSRIEAEASLRKAIEQQNQTDRTRFYFAVVLHETQEVIGEVGFTLSEPLQASCGWFMRTDFQGQGYATEAVKQMIRYAFNSISLEVLMASCRRENAGSVRVMGKCGFILEKESERRSWYTQSRECCRTAL